MGPDFVLFCSCFISTHPLLRCLLRKHAWRRCGLVLRLHGKGAASGQVPDSYSSSISTCALLFLSPYPMISSLPADIGHTLLKRAPGQTLDSVSFKGAPFPSLHCHWAHPAHLLLSQSRLGKQYWSDHWLLMPWQSSEKHHGPASSPQTH